MGNYRMRLQCIFILIASLFREVVDLRRFSENDNIREWKLPFVKRDENVNKRELFKDFCKYLIDKQMKISVFDNLDSSSRLNKQ